MNEQHIARLEAQLERLVEGAFASLFGKKLRPQDIALQLARAMEDYSRAARGGDPRPLAPDQYMIYMSPRVQAQLLQSQPNLPEILGQHMVELANHTGYRLINAPIIKLLADASFEPNHFVVRADHTNRPENSTAVMQRVNLPAESPTPHNPQLVVNGTRTITLSEQIINVGRSSENQVVLDDPYVSRHHIQLRLRFGFYTLFDVQSNGGTYVNGVQVKEHRLQTGDVIRLGRTQMVYIQDEPPSDDSLNDTTGIINPIDRNKRH